MDEKKLVQITRDYYNSNNADHFYFSIWGGEDIHVGLYEPLSISIKEASRKTVEQMADQLGAIDDKTKLLDIGSGYGGSARFLAKKYGCRVTCLNLSEKENERNLQLNKEQELSELIEVRPGNFEELPFEDGAFDIVWCQDAILHSGAKEKVFQEVHRVLKPGGQFIFTDPMQSDDCPEGVLQSVLERIHLKEMGSVKRYKRFAKDLGMSEVSITEMPNHLVNHYQKVLQQLELNYDELKKTCDLAYLDNMAKGLKRWVKAGQSGFLNWGILHFRR